MFGYIRVWEHDESRWDKNIRFDQSRNTNFPSSFSSFWSSEDLDPVGRGGVKKLERSEKPMTPY